MNDNAKNHLLTFEFDKDNEKLEIHADNEGLKILKNKIEMLISSKTNDHSHFLSLDWGGDEITNKKIYENSELIMNVKIIKWNDETIKKMDL